MIRFATLRKKQPRAPLFRGRRAAPGLAFSGFAFAAALWGMFALIPPAAACGSCACVETAHAVTRALVKAEHKGTRIHITTQFSQHQTWLMNDFFKEAVGPALQMMAEQLVSAGMLQTMAVGTFFDAKQQLESQRLVQQKTAVAHKDYQTSAEMCAFGTAARSLAPSNRNAQLVAITLGKRSMDRQLGAADSNAAEGIAQDRAGRLQQFIAHYCDINDNMKGLGALCGSGGPPSQVNKDVDFTRTVDLPATLDIDFSNAALTDGERDAIALQNNLYAHGVFTRIPAGAIATPESQQLILDERALVAKRAVAENSFNSIVGMKSRGNAASAQTAQFASAVLRQLGVPDNEAAALLGSRPSYHAMMDLLGQKIYQSPQFFAALYDTPANVLRKNVAMQAINLMVDRDAFHSELRYEALLSQLLELETAKFQDAVQNRAGNIEGTEKEAR